MPQTNTVQYLIFAKKCVLRKYYIFRVCANENGLNGSVEVGSMSPF